MSATPSAPFVLALRLRRPPDDYTADVPAFRGLERLELDPRVTFFVGENGSGKSTLIEALAVAAKLNAEGGGKLLRFATRSSHSRLHHALELERSALPPLNAFFLRAESVFNLATAIEQGGYIGERENVFERPLHEQSHGESFLSLAANRFGRDGLYLLDEPEAALSVPGELALLAVIARAASAGAQFVVATHSPILLACRDARVYELNGSGVTTPDYDDLQAVSLTRGFLAAPERYLRALDSDALEEDD